MDVTNGRTSRSDSFNFGRRRCANGWCCMFLLYILVQAAETGSGKTGAFCLPVLQIVWETVRDIQTGKLKPLSVDTDKKGLCV
jgi:hypothetical protein